MRTLENFGGFRAEKDAEKTLNNLYRMCVRVFGENANDEFFRRAMLLVDEEEIHMFTVLDFIEKHRLEIKGDDGNNVVEIPEQEPEPDMYNPYAPARPVQPRRPARPVRPAPVVDDGCGGTGGFNDGCGGAAPKKIKKKTIRRNLDDGCGGGNLRWGGGC